MSLKSGQALTVLFTTTNPATGAAADATGTPTGTLYVNGTANGATVTVTNIATGVYKAALTLPSLTAGDVVSLRIAATVAAIAGEGVAFQGVADTKRVSDLVDATAAPSAATVASAVRTELTTELGRVDAAVSSRLASASYTAPPSAAANADAVWDEAISGHLTAGTTGAKLNAAASASGAGSSTYSNTVTDDGSNPLDGVEVWITSDSGGASTVASTTTDSLGTFTVYLDPGTYYLWLAKGGYNFPNPTTITVS